MSVDHLARMRAGLIQQFKGLPNLDAFVHAFGDQLNDVEEFFGQLLVLQTLQESVGVQLDRLGVLLGQGRNGLGDGDYRTILQARIVQYRANGTIEDIIQILLILGGAGSVVISESFPARFQALVYGLNAVVSNSDLAAAVLQTKLAGVRVDVFVPSPTNPQFTFDHVIDSTHAGFDQGHLSGPIT